MLKVKSHAIKPRPTPSGPEGSSGKRTFHVPWGSLAGIGGYAVKRRRVFEGGAQPYEILFAAYDRSVRSVVRGNPRRNPPHRMRSSNREIYFCPSWSQLVSGVPGLSRKL